MVATRGRYAIRVMLDLAEHGADGYIPIKEVAARQEISQKYLERILPLLTKGHLIEGVHGKGGGYRLCRMPQEYSIGEICAPRRMTWHLLPAFRADHVTAVARRDAGRCPCGRNITA